jgi:hypothetical protein
MNNPWLRWLNRMKQKLGQAPGRKPGRKPRRVVVSLEALEARDMPSTFTVTTTNDTNAVNPAVSPLDSSGNISIRSALEALNANPGTNDTIIVPAGHYLLTKAGGAGQGTTGALSITDANGVAIQGAGAGSTLIDAQQLDRVLHFNTGSGTKNLLQGLTIENGLAPIGFFLGSNAAAGGGILDDSGALTIMNCVVTNNEAQGRTTTSAAGGAGYGGGIFDDAGSDPLTIINTTISNNKAIGGHGVSIGGGGFGGGVYVYFSQLAIQSSTFSGNQAVGVTCNCGMNGGNGEGGGLFFVADDHTYVVSDSTFSGNSAIGGNSTGNGYGGAIFNSGSFSEGIPPNRITNTTIANNQANGGNSASGSVGQGGGVYNDYGGEVGIGSTIIAKNTTNGGVGSGQDVFETDSGGVITSLGFNLIGNDDEPTGDFTNGVNHDLVGSPASPINPLLGPLQNNGGPTDTLALIPGSPAIDQGINTFGDVNGATLAFDQRGPGFLRTVRRADLAPTAAADGTDIGAYELQGRFPPVFPTFATKANFLATEATDPRGSLIAQTLFVNGLYNVLLNRAPDQAGLNDWVFLLQSGVPSSEVVAAIYLSPEHRGLQVDGYYQTFLHRTESPAERALWVNVFLAGASEQAVETAFLLSPEYQMSHVSNTAFVTGLYNDVLGRVPDAGLAGWVQALASGASRASVIQAFLTSSEYLSDVVKSYYNFYFQRQGSSAEIQGWVNFLQGGQATLGEVAQLLLNSNEFFFNPP